MHRCAATIARNVGAEDEQAAEPGADGGAVVVGVAEQVDQIGGIDPGEDDDQQQDQRDPVDRRGGGPDPGTNSRRIASMMTPPMTRTAASVPAVAANQW